MYEQPDFSSVTISGNFAQFLAELDNAAFWDYAAQLSHSPTIPTTTQNPELLLCTLEDISCLLPLLHLREILSAPRQYTSLPLTPPWMLGVISWHGETIPLLDLSAYLMQHPARWHAADTLLITESAGCIVAWLVSSVEAIPASLLEAEIDPEQSPTQSTSWYNYLLPSGMVIKTYTHMPLLDLALLITEATQSIEGATSYDE